jgi:hypothetical protein
MFAAYCKVSKSCSFAGQQLLPYYSKCIFSLDILRLTNEQVITFDGWVLNRLRDRLRRASIIASRTGRPVVLYRYIIEEMDHSAEEEIATVNEQYVVVQVITHGGFIPPSFQQQYVFTFWQFSDWIMKGSEELLALCLDSLDQEIVD